LSDSISTPGCRRRDKPFVAELQKIAEYCDFKELLRDRIVCGIRDKNVQHLHRLLVETDLTFDKAMQLAQAAETAEKDARARGPLRSGEQRGGRDTATMQASAM
jgi:hypothetical protein